MRVVQCKDKNKYKIQSIKQTIYISSNGNEELRFGFTRLLDGVSRDSYLSGWLPFQCFYGGVCCHE